jgi:multidrug resistance protein MdtO
MAPNAIERPAQYMAGLLRLLAPRPGRLEFAVRLALICALTVLVAEIYQTPEPALTAYIAFFLNQEDRTTSLILDVALVIVLSLIIGLVFVVAMAVLDDSMWRFISIAALSFGFLYLASASKLRPIAGTLALIVGYALDELGLIQSGELGTRALLYAWLFAGIPAGVSIIVNLLMAPPPRRLAERAIALRLRLCATMLREPDEKCRRQFEELLREGTVEIQKRLKLAGVEKTSPADDIEALRQAADSTIVLLSAIDVMDRNPDAALPASVRHSLARTLDDMAAILEAGGYPVEIILEIPDDGGVLSPLAAEVLARVNDAIMRFAAPSAPATPAEETRNEKSGFFVEDAFTNPDHVHYALKTTVAALSCYILYSLLDWSGIHTCFITCYIVSLSTTAESVEKLTLRILGCLVGAAAGYAAILFLIPSLTDIGALMAVIFVGACAAAYVAAGGPRIAYAGFQIAFAFFLCVVQGASPAFDLTVARDRVVGILLGNLVSYLVFTNLWPVSVRNRIDPAIGALLDNLRALATAAHAPDRRALASQTETELAAIEADIDLAGYEPESVRPSQAWLAARRQAADAIASIIPPLLLADSQASIISVHIANRLDAVAGRIETSDHHAPPPSEPPPSWKTNPMSGMILRGLGRLEQALTRKV